MRKTKIIATLGPSSSSRQVLEEMVAAGMDGCRLNFSHLGHREAEELIATVRRVSEDMKKPICVRQDLRGPKIRVGTVAPGTVLADGQEFLLVTGDITGNARMAGVSYRGLPADVQPGDVIMLDDGTITLQAVDCGTDHIRCRVVRGGALSSNKGINVPGRELSLSGFTEKDLLDVQFGIRQGVDMVSISFVRRRSDVQAVRDTLNLNGCYIPIIAKLETQTGVRNLDEILSAADGISVARGDLGVEYPAEDVPFLQKRIVTRARQAGKLSMVGAQVLHSMVGQASPTRAEITDVAFAVMNGVDAVCLSAETAVGKYPAAAVRVASAAAERAETYLASEGHYADFGDKKVVAVYTETGHAALRLSSLRPRIPILALTPDKSLCQILAHWWGVTPVLINESPTSIKALSRMAADLSAEVLGIPCDGSDIMLVAGEEKPLFSCGNRAAGTHADPVCKSREGRI